MSEDEEDLKVLQIRHIKLVEGMRICTECGGYGIVEYAYEDALDKSHYIDGDCPLCEGFGTIAKE
jgi:hypothetical protein